MTVPTDKEFILTDIIATSVPTSQNIYLSVKEDSVMKIPSLFVAGNTGGLFNLTSGIPFSPGPDVVFNAQFVGSQVYLTITGYPLDHLDP